MAPYDAENDRRRAIRFEVRAPTQYANHERGTGTTENVSVSGVLIQNATRAVGVGSSLEVRFSFFPGSFDTPFTARVIRHTDDGFALQFDDLGPPQISLLRSALPPGAFA